MQFSPVLLSHIFLIIIAVPPLVRRRTSVPLKFSAIETATSLPNISASTTSPENEEVQSVGISSAFGVEYPEPIFLFSPLWGQSLLLAFLNSSLLKVR